MTRPRALTKNLRFALAAFTLALAVAYSAAPARAQQPPPLTVERIYAAPSLAGVELTDPAWSPDGSRLTYLMDGDEAGDSASSGRPKLWIVEAATGQRRVLLDADHLAKLLGPPASRGEQTGLGRVTPPSYFWAPDGQALLFASSTQLAWYDLASHASKILVRAQHAAASDEGDVAADLDDPKISPDGRWVSFLHDHDIWAVNVSTGQVRAVTTGGSEPLRHGELDWIYPEELDLHTAYWWSPDSAHIAFLQLDERPVTRYPLVDDLDPRGTPLFERYPAAGDPNPIAQVGVIAVTGGATHWLDSGADTSVLLARVAWLPDSKRVAIQRLNRAQTQLDLLFADATTGRAATILTERDNNWINVSDILYFFSDGHRFIWSSERSGFRHLYLYDVSGQLIAQLTRGDWEVESLEGVDEEAQSAYYISTQKNPMERQLYRVSLSGGDPVPITHTAGTHSVLMAPAGCAHFVDTSSTEMSPPWEQLDRADGSLELILNENRVPDLEAAHLTPVEFFTIPGADGTPLDASLIKPPDFDPAKQYPVLVHYYGGPGAQEVLNAWDAGTQWQMFLWEELMAQKGFVVFTLDNRGTAGRGHAFETPIARHFGTIETTDQLAGVAWLKQQSWADTSRMGIWGWSFGGYLTCYLMLDAPGIFRAGLAVAPVTDWRLYDTIYTERYMGTPQDNPAGYRASSLLDKASALEGKLLIAHGTGDDNVHFGQTVSLANSFVHAGKYAEYQLYAGRGHGISDPSSRIHLFTRATQFFLDNVKGP
ncbi:MAG: S9 family peptidase [Candidatus Acidiferrales bacterium]|jgi:dipeptidyl-peptidase-4